MAPSLDRSGLSYDNIGALSQLVEAASALTELEVNESSTKKALPTALVSDDDEISRVTTKTIDTASTSSNQKKKEIFPQKLMEILGDASVSDIVSWLPHGRSFVIIRPDLFCEQVLPRYLPPADSRGSTKYPSFTRKLNRWGFRQATRGADTGAFHHPFFRRDQPKLCVKMVCQKSRDRQHGHDKQRSLPPKKRSIPEGAPLALGNSQKAMSSMVCDADIVAISTATRQSVQMPGIVTADDRSISTSSTTSQTSFNNSMGRRGASRVMPFISNDTKFVASTLRQRESLEVYRAAKAMLYDAYMKAVNQEVP
eukprot:jgi/Psemu1/222030/e_gw1.1179.22.1